LCSTAKAEAVPARILDENQRIYPFSGQSTRMERTNPVQPTNHAHHRRAARQKWAFTVL
jgi:hypothetical protein